jgi:hypothetical protein
MSLRISKDRQQRNNTNGVSACRGTSRAERTTITREQLDEDDVRPILQKENSESGPERNHNSGADYKNQDVMHDYGAVAQVLTIVCDGNTHEGTIPYPAASSSQAALKREL